MEKHFLEFLKNRTTSRVIPKFSKNVYREFPFFLILFPEFPGIFDWMVCVSEIQQFSDFSETFQENFRTICPCIGSSWIFGWMKSALESQSCCVLSPSICDWVVDWFHVESIKILVCRSACASIYVLFVCLFFIRSGWDGHVRSTIGSPFNSLSTLH